jgi:hypothetical protein
MLDVTDNRNPDIVIVKEGNTKTQDAIRKSAPRYGHQGVLLSIVIDPLRLSKKIEEIKGYPQFKRLPRPLSPRYLSRALISYINKLKHLREGKAATRDEKSQQDKEKKGEENRQNNEGSASKDSNRRSPLPDKRIQRPHSAPSQSIIQQES